MGSPPAPGVLRVAGEEEEKSPAQAVPREEDPGSGGGTRGSHPAWEVIPCCHKGGHGYRVFTPCPGTLTPSGCCLGESQARREHRKGFPTAKRA